MHDEHIINQPHTVECNGSSCDDGLYCNGDEYCFEGSCYSGQNVTCGFAFYCDETIKSCERDCDSFDIDGSILQLEECVSVQYTG